MKTKNILIYSTLSMAVMALWGCTKEVDYDPAQPMTNAQVFFASNAKSSFDLNENQNEVTIELSRANTSGATSVELKGSAVMQTAEGDVETDIFNIPSSVSFADGSDSAPINISFDFNEIKAETNYIITLDIAGEALSVYGKSQQEVKILYAPWSSWETMSGSGTYTNGSPFGFSDAVTVEKRTSLLNPDNVQYRIPNLFAEEPTLFSVNLADNIVTVSPQVTSSKSDGYPIRMCDTYTFFTEVAKGDPEPYLGKSFFDKETGLITVNMVFYTLKDGGSIGWWGADNYDYVQLPGYPNYNISVSNSGTFINEQGQEFTILSVVKGSDVASYAINLVQGSLNPEQIQAEVDAMIANTETVLYNDNRDFQFPVTEEDYYTCITVAYGSDGEPKGHSNYIFYNELNGVDWNEGWTTVATQAEFQDIFYANVLFAGLNKWNVEVQQNDSNPGIYRIVKPYANNIYGETPERGHYYVTIDATNPDAVVVPPSLTSFGYWVFSQAPGKLVDGTKFVFPGFSLGVFNGYNEDGSMICVSGWSEEAVLIDLAPVKEEEPAPAAVMKKAKMEPKVSLKRENVIPYSGKKVKKQPVILY